MELPYQKMSEKRWIRKARIWRPLLDLRVREDIPWCVFCCSCWSHPSVWPVPALRFYWCCQLPWPLTGRSVSQFWIFGSHWGRVGKVSGELAPMAAIILPEVRIVRTNCSQGSPQWRIPSGHASEMIPEETGKGYTPFPHWIQLLSLTW